MRLLLMLLIGTLATSDTFSLGMSLGPGLSVKNALIYPIALGLVFRMAMTGNFRVRLPIVNFAFVVWMSYALLTWVACITLIQYPGYKPIHEAISLKSLLLDSAVFFFVYFYGADKEEDFFVLAKTLGFCVGVANILTLMDVAGIIHLNITIGDSGVEADRVFGVFGHANDTAALMDCVLPLLAAIATSARGGWAKLFWWSSALASLAVLLLSISRGAYVGVAIGYTTALWLCRRYLPTSRVVAWIVIGGTSLLVAAALAAFLMPVFTQALTERLFNQSMAVSVATASSGRTAIWMAALNKMGEHPITFLTGFGFGVHQLMFTLVTHNYYLDQWFGLGLTGLFAFITILYQTVTTALRAVAVADARLRPYMIAFVFGMLGLAVAIFFVNLERPWDYVWLYAGFTLSAAVRALEKAQSAPARAVKTVPQPAGRAPIAVARAARPRLVGDVRR